MSSTDTSRREFLARIGVLGAGALVLPRCTVAPNGSGGLESELLGIGQIIGLLRPVLADLSRDTMNGFVAFSLPGQDAYSRAQGTVRSEPGGLQAGGTEFLIRNLDRFLPLPDELVRPASAAL